MAGLPEPRDLPVTIRLERAEADDLATLLCFLGDWLESPGSERLAASLRHFVGAGSGVDLSELQADLGYFTALLSTATPSRAPAPPVTSSGRPPRMTA